MYETKKLILLLCLLFAGCSSQPQESSAPVDTSVGTSVGANSPADIPPQVDGVIKSIQAGTPSYVTLKDVSILSKGKSKQLAEKKMKLLGGHFVAPNHWQSDGDTLDLFIGDHFTMLTEKGYVYDESDISQFAGLVQSIKPHQMVVEKILYDFGEGYGMKYAHQNVTIHFAPYTKVSLNGYGKGKISDIKKGDAVLFVLIGPPHNYIARQITDFHSIQDAGWHMKNK